MNDNELPEGKVIVKRVLVVIVFLLCLIVAVCAKQYMSVVLSIIIGLVLLFLFIRLCFDVHKIAKHFEDLGKKE